MRFVTHEHIPRTGHVRGLSRPCSVGFQSHPDWGAGSVAIFKSSEPQRLAPSFLSAKFLDVLGLLGCPCSSRLWHQGSGLHMDG